MKLFSKLIMVFFVSFQLNLYSQILNAGFENWNTNNDPENWFSLDVFGFADGVQQSSDSHSGASAAKFEIVSVGGLGIRHFPILWSGDIGNGFPVAQRYGSLNGFYKFITTTGDALLMIEVIMTKYNSSMGFSIAVGEGNLLTFQEVSSYSEFSVPITYFDEEVPDTIEIYIQVADTSSNSSGGIGSYALIDDLSLGESTVVKPVNNKPVSFSLSQNYPNPFNPSTKINFSILEQSYVELMIYDILGNKITKLVSDTYSSGEYTVDFNAENLPAGIYLARITAGKYSNTVKMTLLK
jgi:hypothetical protein